MKIDKKRVIEIINEEYEMMQMQNRHHHRGQIHDEEGDMAKSQLEQIAKYAIELHQMIEPYGDNMQLESWVQSKLTICKEYISKVKHYLEHELNVDNDNSPKR